MTDKFAEYYSSDEKIDELSEYVHQNYKLICTKMISEMRRNLCIKPDLENSEGYVSLQVSLMGRLFNEMIYSLAGTCQSFDLKLTDIVPANTFMILFDLLEEKNPLNGSIRKDVKIDLEGFKKYYTQNIDQLRSITEALPKDSEDK